MNLFRPIPATLLFATLIGAGCDTATDGGDLDILSTESEAYTELENQLYALSTATINNSSDLDQINFDAANTMFKSILEKDASHPGANFGAALTEVFGAFADPEVNDAIKRWENSGGTAPQGTHLFRFGIPTGIGSMTVPNKALAENLGKMIIKGLTDPPTIAEVQAVLRDHVAPRLDYAMQRLSIVEQDPAFELRITGKMQGDPNLSPVYLDLTEVYVIDAMIRGMKAGVDQFLVYRFDLASYATEDVLEALQPTNNTFFVLADDGSTRALGIHSNLLTLVEKLRNGIAFLKGESDNQSDDIIKLGPSGVASSDLDTLDSYLSQATTWLSSSQSVEIKDADTDGNNYTIDVNIQAFFQNPPQNPKTAWFPPYSVDSSSTGDIVFRWTQEDYATFTFPDPSFGGVFPGMSNTTLKRLMHLDESFAWDVSVYLFDESYAMTTSAVTITVNNQTYSPKPRYTWSWNGYANYRFLILDNDGQNAAMNVVYNSTPVTIDFNEPVIVRLKSSAYINVDVTPASQVATGTGYGPSPRYASLSLNQYGLYYIERRTTGSFTLIDSTWSWTYTDNNLPSAGTYEYRARRSWSPYWYGIIGARSNNYTNTIVVNVP